MTWLAPWALGAGALGLLGVVAAHMLSRQRPRAVALATTRFLPSGMLEATTVQTVPIDRWWMLLRLLIIALLALGVAQPVLTGTKVPMRTVLLLDQALPVQAQRSAVAALAPTDVVIGFDTVSTLRAAPEFTPAVAGRSRLNAALGRLVRVRDSLAARSTGLRITIASHFDRTMLDPASAEIRALIPDSIVVMPVTVEPDSGIVRGAITVHADVNDPIAATAQLLGDSVAPSGALVQRGPALTGEDSLAARNGATVVWWPAGTVSGKPALQAITVGATTWIAPFGRDSIMAAGTGEAVGWWAAGEPAVWRTNVGRGCVLSVHAAVPVVGDQTLSLTAQAWLASLLTTCDRNVRGVPVIPRWLEPPPATRAAVVSQASLTSSAAPWLVGAALALALLELALRPGRKA